MYATLPRTCKHTCEHLFNTQYYNQYTVEKNKFYTYFPSIGVANEGGLTFRTEVTNNHVVILASTGTFTN